MTVGVRIRKRETEKKKQPSGKKKQFLINMTKKGTSVSRQNQHHYHTSPGQEAKTSN